LSEPAAEAAPAAPPPAGPRSWRRRRLRVFADTLRLLVRMGGAVLGVAVIALLVGLFLLAQGPLSLGFLSPWLNGAVERATGLRLEVADTVVAWSEQDRRIALRLIGAKVATPAGDLLASVPQMALRLAAGQLLRGRLEIEAIDLLAPTLHLRRQSDGKLALDLGGGMPAIGDLLGATEPAPVPLMQVRRVRAIGADLLLRDEASGRQLRLPQVNLTLLLHEAMPELLLDAALPLPTGPAGLELHARPLPGGQGAAVRGRFHDLNPAALARLLPFPELAPLAGADLPLTGALTLEATREGIGGLSLTLNGDGGRLALPSLWPEALLLDRLALRLESQGLAGGQPLRLEQATLRFANGFEVGLQGEVLPGAPIWDPAQLAASLQGRFSNFPAAEFHRYWPLGVGSNARAWFVENIQRGTVTAGEFSLKAKPGDLAGGPPPADLLQMRFAYQGLAGRFWKALPSLQDASGEVRVSADDATLLVAQGRIGEVRVSEGRVHVTGFNAGEQWADVDYKAEASARAAFELMDREPLGFARDLGIKPAEVAGRVAVAARFRLPLRNDIAVKDLDFAAAARLSGLALPAVAEGVPLQEGELLVHVRRDGAEAAGEARLAGVRSNLRWRRDFQGRGQDLSRFSLAASLEEADRLRLGLPGPPHLFGAVTLAVQGVERPGGQLVLNGSADLAAARLLVAELELEKPMGRPARLDFEAEIVPKTGSQLSFRLASDMLAANGSLRLAADAAVQAVNLAELRFAENALVLQATRQEPAGWQLRLGGSQLDLRRYLSGTGDGSGGDDGPPVQLEFALARVLLDDAVELQAVSGRGARRTGKWQELSATGLLNADAPVRLSYREDAQGGRLDAQADDAGRVARALDLTRSMVGGRLELTLAVPPAGPMAGRLRAENFRIARAPVLARILALGSFTGLRDVMAGDGIGFLFFDASFQLAAGKITLAEARGAGSALGLTLAGTVDRNRDLLDLTGTVVPAYTINSVLGNLPLVGEIFVGRKGEGVFAVSFAVNGPSERPEVSVNPLSALAPGFLRRIVEGLERLGPAAPDPGRPNLEQSGGR